MKEGIVTRIIVESDRVLLFLDHREDYHIIAKPGDGATASLGSRILYEPYGVNFGWFVSVAP